jgi:H/ACA ribonucleoprotein complex subunit 4
MSVDSGDHRSLRPERPIDELLKNGVINLDKPSGPSSHQVSSWVKGIFGIEKAGHGGTLDPNVTGVLPVSLQDATKALYALLHGEKEYVCAMRIHKEVQSDRILWTLKDFVGDIYQTPPLKSAVKKELRIRRIYKLDVLESEGRDVLFSVKCDPGTYIRTLCHDIGDALGVGAHMANLRRTRVANFREEDSFILQDVKDAYEHWKESGDEEPLRKVVLPVEALLDHLPKVVLRDTAVDAVCHGADLAVPGIAHADEHIKKDDLVAMLTTKREAVGIGIALFAHGKMLKMRSGIVIDTKRVLMKTGTYRKAWKRKSKLLNDVY